MPAKAHKHIIKGREYKLKYVSPKTILKYCDKDEDDGVVIGLCDDPCEKDPQILIDKELKGKQMLQTIVHEFLHSYNWKWSERFVESLAINLGEVLYENGYRKVR